MITLQKIFELEKDLEKLNEDMKEMDAKLDKILELSIHIANKMAGRP